jgi:5'-3' exonuclease
MIAPLINDILKYFPKSIKIENDIRELCPVEQLLLAIPIDTYKYVINKSLISKMKKNKEIGYMFPETFDIDINKESVFWKCQVKIPMVEYYEYIKNIKLINIHDEKNEILKNIYN